jgi:hypothetical protein
MRPGQRFGLSAIEKRDVWSRWKAGQSLHEIGALLETDDSKLARRVYEALAAIEQRLLSPIEPGSDEEKALKTAQKLLTVIKAEKLDQQA